MRYHRHEKLWGVMDEAPGCCAAPLVGAGSEGLPGDVELAPMRASPTPPGLDQAQGLRDGVLCTPVCFWHGEPGCKAREGAPHWAKM